MPYADLHVHTTRSDGNLALDAVPEVATRAGLTVVAVTDHDRLQSFEEPIVERDGVSIIHGIELRVETEGGQRVDLLGYGVEATDELAAITDRVQTNRIERGRAIVDCLEDRLGVDLDVAVTDGFGRPHAARAVDEHPDLAYDYEDAFEHLIGSDCPCFVPRDVPSFDRGRDALAEAASLVSLAHPLRYRDPESALALSADLDAVELWYPYGRDVDRRPVREAIERHGLLATGGTDAHDDTLGLAGLSRSEYERLDLSER